MHLSSSGALSSCLLERNPNVWVSRKFVGSQSSSVNIMPAASVTISLDIGAFIHLQGSINKTPAFLEQYKA